MRILIVDDEKKSREVLKALIELYYENIEAIETCQDIAGAKKAIIDFKPNLAFLDISLREGDSYQLLNEIGDFDFEIIFITAFDENSIRVLNYCGFPTLMKPIDVEQLVNEITNSTSRLNTGFSRNQYKLARFLFAKPIQQFPVFVHNHWELIPIADISELEKEAGGKTLLKLKSGKTLLTPANIATIQELLATVN